MFTPTWPPLNFAHGWSASVTLWDSLSLVCTFAQSDDWASARYAVHTVELDSLATLVFLFFDFSLDSSVCVQATPLPHSTIWLQHVQVHCQSVCSSMSTMCQANNNPCATQCEVRHTPNMPCIALVDYIAEIGNSHVPPICAVWHCRALCVIVSILATWSSMLK